MKQFKEHGVPKNKIQNMKEEFGRFLWGYDILDSLIEDEDISDIKCYAHDRITIKSKGKRYLTALQFRSQKDYIRFVNFVAVKNQVNLSNVNALQFFMDINSSKNFRLRMNITSGYINTSMLPFLHIRKIPKIKKSMETLCNEGLLTGPVMVRFFKMIAVRSGGILYVGAGGSGKTTLMNTMLEFVPKTDAGVCIQECDELFSETHPDFLFQHTVENNGEGKISYGLKDLARNGLRIDINRFIIGEIKGDEAADLMIASYTGHKCWTSSHGKSAIDGFFKLADYVKRASGYTYTECMKMLMGMQHIIYLENYKVKEIVEITGWNEAAHHPVFKNIHIKEQHAPGKEGKDVCYTDEYSDINTLSCDGISDGKETTEDEGFDKIFRTDGKEGNTE